MFVDVSADICFSLNSDECGIVENSLPLPFANPATQHNINISIPKYIGLIKPVVIQTVQFNPTKL